MLAVIAQLDGMMISTPLKCIRHIQPQWSLNLARTWLQAFFLFPEPKRKVVQKNCEQKVGRADRVKKVIRAAEIRAGEKSEERQSRSLDLY
jgi:hypothetical protein